MEILSDRDEAERTLLGVENGLTVVPDTMLVIDIGGGSTEFILKELGEPFCYVSTPLGVVKLTEEYLRTAPPSVDDQRRLTRNIESVLRGVWMNLKPKNRPCVIGTAGTATTLAAMELGMKAYDPARAQNHRMTLGQTDSWYHRLASSTLSERLRIDGLERGREDLIVAGVAVLVAFLRQTGIQEWMVSDYGLREGLLVHWFRVYGRDFGNIKNNFVK